MNLDQFKVEARWSPGGGLDSAANYMGPDLSEFLKGPSRSRDSDILAESNFAVALEMLGGESDTVSVERFGHWACGWFELILVKSNDQKAVKTLFKIYQSLEDYPVLDDSDYYERQSEACDETFSQYESDFCETVFEVLVGDRWADINLFDAVTADPQFVNFVREVYDQDRGYHGDEDAWVSPEAVLRYTQARYVNEESPYRSLARTVFGLDETEGAV